MTSLSHYSPHLILEQIEVGPMANFTYVVGSSETREVVLVDPAWEIQRIIDYVHEQDFRVVGALVTHYHPDHVGGHFAGYEIEGLAQLFEHFGTKVYVHKFDADGVKQLTGLTDSDIVQVEANDHLSVGTVDIEFLHTPGHTPGSQCFRVKDSLISGDTLFINSCGRVDLPGSDPVEMFRSLQKLKTLPNDTLLLPGHNYAHVAHSTMEEAKACNATLNVVDFAAWTQMMSP